MNTTPPPGDYVYDIRIEVARDADGITSMRMFLGLLPDDVLGTLAEHARLEWQARDEARR